MSLIANAFNEGCLFQFVKFIDRAALKQCCDDKVPKEGLK
ncbi:Unknown protein sequence [Pseudomonas syringae pv. maculicola]|nr:Unknown protein sequence [Pseudomonas syringae pv. maculicola]